MREDVQKSVVDLIRERRTIHAFDERPVSREPLLRAIELGRWAPNHHHTEPWLFTLPGPRTVRAIVELNTSIVRQNKGETAAEAKQKRWSEIPGWFCLTCRESPDEAQRWEDYAACCCALQNVALSLWSEGIGMKWGTGPVTRHPEFLPLLGLEPAEHRVVGLCWYGYPRQVPSQQRLPVDEVTRELD